MTKSALVYAGALVATSCWCGIHLAIPDSLYGEATNKGQSVYCPLGHTFVYGDPEMDRLKRDLKHYRDLSASRQAVIDQKSASLRATKGVVTKMRRRAIAGVCQFCHRHFKDVERHVHSKHPGEQA